MKWELITRYAVLLPLIAMLCPQVHADSELADFTEEDLFIDIPQVFSATRQTQKLTEAPAAITIINAEEIKAIGALKITDIFRMVPGMQSYHVTANKSSASYHGMSDDHPGRMEVMINGHSVYLPLLSTVAWETFGISIEDIDYIEIVRGSNAPAYGSNAFLGAINIVTKSPISELNSQVSVTHGALNTQQYNLSHSHTSDSLAYRLSAHFEDNDGYHLYDDGAVNRILNISGTYTPTFSDTIDFNIGLSSGFIYSGQADNINNNFSPRSHQSNFQHIRWNRILDEKNELKISFTHNHLNIGEEFRDAVSALAHLEKIDNATAQFLIDNNINGLGSLAGTQQALGTEHGSIDLYDLEAEHRTSINSTLTSVWGGGYRLEEAKSETLLQGQGTVTEDKWRLFGNLQWTPIKSLNINAGGMFEHTSISSSHFSPRLAANYSLSDSSSIRASVTKAYRTPSLLELNGTAGFKNNSGGYYDLITLPNTDLKPERLTSYEIGYFQQGTSTGNFFDFRLFTEKVEDGIDSFSFDNTDKPNVDDINDGYRISDNVASWKNLGAEFQLKLHFNPQLSLLTNYSYLNVKGVRDRGSKLLDSLDDRTPLHTASMLLQWQPIQNVSVSAAQYYMSSAKWLEGGYRKQYRRTDLVVASSFLLQNSKLNTKVIIQNLFDEPYQEFYEFNVFDRRAYLQLQLEF